MHNVYETSNLIFSVSGYNYPIGIPLDYNVNFYLFKGFSAWGVDYGVKNGDK